MILELLYYVSYFYTAARIFTSHSLFFYVVFYVLSKCQLYADETVIYVSAQTPYLAAEILTNEMTGVSHWLQNNCLTLNCSKTVSMCFSIRRKEMSGFIIKINQKAIETVNHFKYLSVILDSHLRFDMHVKRQSEQI